MTGRVALKCSAALISLLLHNAAYSQQQKSFDVDSKEAVRAIPEFARQAGIQIIAPADDLKGVILPAIKGSFDIRAALRQLLGNTNLEVASDDGQIVTLRTKPRAVKAEPPAITPQKRTLAKPPAPPPLPLFELGHLQEIVITGSRIMRDGYEAPTPLTVLDASLLAQQTATANVADTLNTIPLFAGSLTPTLGVGGPSTIQGGLNTLSLRGLSSRRTLVLLDGKRSVGSQTSGVVDINSFPQQLISRVDIVTGGASAVYGSDAVGGVVNFVLDKNFVGSKGEASGGLTTQGDDPHYKIALTGGFTFGGDRGHLLLSGEFNKKHGIFNGTNGREWSKGGAGIVSNPAYTPTNGQPEYLVRNDVSLSNATHGGIIVSGPLKGVAFGVGGTPYRFNYGPIVSGIYMAGGDWRSTLVRADAISLDPKATRKNVFLRASYDVSENLNIYGQFSWNSSFDDNRGFPAYQPGNGPIIQSGNPFIPESIQERMTALGLTSFQIGTTNYDRPFIGSRSLRQTNRNILGANGKLEAFDAPWTWNAYAQNGYTRISFNATGVARKSRFTEAIDAVRDPASGAVVCRSTLTSPGNGCSPWNPLGLGVNNDAGLQYILGGTGGIAHVNQKLEQNVFAASIAGEPLANWAGPVSLAFNVEHRRESARSIPDPVARSGDWWAGNFQFLDAGYSVTEGAVETVIPIANNKTFAEKWDVSAAFRGTGYSTTGYASTWKIGTTYAPVASIKLRLTRSRDIRAPNLDELYSNAILGFDTGLDVFTNSVTTFVLRREGNVLLRPERADATNIGIVLQPTIFPAFSASMDWWNIDMKDAVHLPTPSDVVRLCFEGRQTYCDDITRVDGVITDLTQTPFNLAVHTSRGIDFEGSYRFDAANVVPSWAGEVILHGNATLYLKSYINPGISTPTDDVGQNGGSSSSVAPPNWRVTASVDYKRGGLLTSMTARIVSAGTLNNSYVTCTSACPLSSARNRTIDSNSLPGALYFDASVNYGWNMGERATVEVFLNVKNLMDKNPPPVPRTADQFGYVVPITNIARYDYLGRVVKAGLRFQM